MRQFPWFSRKPVLDLPVHQVLPAQSRLEGKLTFSGGLHIQGQVEGELVAQGSNTNIVVDRNALVTTQILRADTVLIHGKVDAQFIRGQRIVLASSARVTGTLEAGAVEIQEGARFEGRVAVQGIEKTETPAVGISVSGGSAEAARERLKDVLGHAKSHTEHA